ncbi:MAG: glycoside hydrolase family 15 [Tannerellaceae bacterium]|nr:glycoside hydrolase family 15 [Tannerellaceae bacterium]
MAAEKLFEIWGRRNPEFETRYEDKIIKMFSDYGKGTTGYQESRGKLFGAGYEVYLMAFFIGLYFNKRKELNQDKNKRKTFGQPLQYWGNQETRKFRKSYGKIRDYIFVALVARSDVDFIELDKGKITPRKAVDILIQTMEEYANFGFDYMEDKLIDNPDYFYRNSAFLDLFLSFCHVEEEDSEEEEAESLD